MRGMHVWVLAALVFMGSVGLVWDPAPARAASEAEALAVEHGKLSTADATPVDPGRVELEFGYAYAWSRRDWNASGRVKGRDLVRSARWAWP